ncbi:hypothetical protein CYMTET_52111, partial [Cymbomonas tetramitiformis]
RRSCIVIAEDPKPAQVHGASTRVDGGGAAQPAGTEARDVPCLEAEGWLGATDAPGRSYLELLSTSYDTAGIEQASLLEGELAAPRAVDGDHGDLGWELPSAVEPVTDFAGAEHDTAREMPHAGVHDASPPARCEEGTQASGRGHEVGGWDWPWRDAGVARMSTEEALISAGDPLPDDRRMRLATLGRHHPTGGVAAGDTAEPVLAAAAARSDQKFISSAPEVEEGTHETALARLSLEDTDHGTEAPRATGRASAGAGHRHPARRLLHPGGLAAADQPRVHVQPTAGEADAEPGAKRGAEDGSKTESEEEEEEEELKRAMHSSRAVACVKVHGFCRMNLGSLSEENSPLADGTTIKFSETKSSLKGSTAGAGPPAAAPSVARPPRAQLTTLSMFPKVVESNFNSARQREAADSAVLDVLVGDKPDEVEPKDSTSMAWQYGGSIRPSPEESPPRAEMRRGGMGAHPNQGADRPPFRVHAAGETPPRGLPPSPSENATPAPPQLGLGSVLASVTDVPSDNPSTPRAPKIVSCVLVEAEERPLPELKDTARVAEVDKVGDVAEGGRPIKDDSKLHIEAKVVQQAGEVAEAHRQPTQEASALPALEARPLGSFLPMNMETGSRPQLDHRKPYPHTRASSRASFANAASSDEMTSGAPHQPTAVAGSLRRTRSGPWKRRSLFTRRIWNDAAAKDIRRASLHLQSLLESSQDKGGQRPQPGATSAAAESIEMPAVGETSLVDDMTYDATKSSGAVEMLKEGRLRACTAPSGIDRGRVSSSESMREIAASPLAESRKKRAQSALTEAPFSILRGDNSAFHHKRNPARRRLSTLKPMPESYVLANEGLKSHDWQRHIMESELAGSASSVTDVDNFLIQNVVSNPLPKNGFKSIVNFPANNMTTSNNWLSPIRKLRNKHFFRSSRRSGGIRGQLIDTSMPEEEQEKVRQLLGFVCVRNAMENGLFEVEIRQANNTRVVAYSILTGKMWRRSILFLCFIHLMLAYWEPPSFRQNRRSNDVVYEFNGRKDLCLIIELSFTLVYIGDLALGYFLITRRLSQRNTVKLAVVFLIFLDVVINLMMPTANASDGVSDLLWIRWSRPLRPVLLLVNSHTLLETFYPVALSGLAMLKAVVFIVFTVLLFALGGIELFGSSRNWIQFEEELEDCDFNFQDILYAFTSLFVLMTTENYPCIVLPAMRGRIEFTNSSMEAKYEALGVDYLNPNNWEKNAHQLNVPTVHITEEIYANLVNDGQVDEERLSHKVFFIVFIAVGSFGLTNIFIAIVYSTYRKYSHKLIVAQRINQRRTLLVAFELLSEKNQAEMTQVGPRQR